ncbi:hypothetical protein MMPV_006028 [Pyropia vietnamensis]
MAHRSLLPLLSLTAALAAATAAILPAAAGRPVLAKGTGGAAPSVEWNYSPDSPNGPSHWGDLHPSFKTCSRGHRQSPIDIPSWKFGQAKGNSTMSSVLAIPPSLTLVPHAGRINMAMNCATFGRCGSLRWQDRTYFFTNLHFHQTSEHRRGGATLAMEAHLVMSTHEKVTKGGGSKGNGGVHAHEEPRLAVVGVFLELGQANAVLDEVLDGLEAGADVPITDLWDNLLVPDSGYCAWQGSLTTPPCTEGVEWLMQTQPVRASRRQLERFATDIHEGVDGVNRPVQPRNDREVQCYRKH